MSDSPFSRAFPRRTALRTMAVAAVAVPVALGSPANAAPWSPKAAPLWHPVPSTDGLNAFEGVEADRGHLHPARKYVYAEGGDHYRFNIWRDDRDTTGGGDRQRTEVKGMVQNGAALKMHDGETWTIAYDMYMPSTLHGTSKFTHIFQTKTPSTNAGPWVTLDLTRSGGKEFISARAYANAGSPSIASTELAPLRDKWVSVQWTLTIGAKGTAAFLIRNGAGSGAPIAAQGSLTKVNIPDQGDYVRPKWGIYRSVQSAASDIVDTYLLFRNYTASRK
ncbi:hypothetical protein [Amycolatopsis sp. NBC_01480]|uniref:hypothetical protein n=1 Tax=Amycolatopsis sp. NBC_01480 TaxID=2903562 RepID=UPI002E29B416|nr:hypothetical protein [Amycolatopsis sp. NBC_01480]